MEPKEYEKCEKREILIGSKLHMSYISSNNGRHILTETFTPLHYTSPSHTSLHFTTLVGTSLLI